MTNGQRVLVVDGLAETEEVLKAVLEPQGLEVNRIRTHFARTAPTHQPHVVILHEDHNASDSPADDSWPDVPRVIIGSVRVPRTEAGKDSREHYLSQPFHYRDLIQAVEQLLAE